MRDQNSKPNRLKINPDDLDSIRPPWGEKTRAYVTLQGTFSRILLIFQYIAVTKYYFFNLQSIGTGPVIDVPSKQLVEGKSSDTNTM